MQFKYGFIPKKLAGTKGFSELEQAAKNGTFPIAVSGAAHIHRVVMSAVLMSELGRKALVVTAGESESERVLEDLSALGVNVLRLPARDYSFRGGVTVSHEYEHARIGTLARMLAGDFDLCVASADAAASITVPPEVLKRRCFTVRCDESVSEETLVSRLIAGGYKRCDQVEGAGQFSVRGAILDIFTPNLPEPCRIDFFGDDIDSISLFDPDTQRRTEPQDAVDIFPVCEVSPDSSEQLSEALKALSKRRMQPAQKGRILADIARIESGESICCDAYLNIVYDRPATVFDYLPQDAFTFVFDSSAVSDRIKSVIELHLEEIKTLLADGELPPDFRSVYLDKPRFSAELTAHNTVYFDSFPKTSYDPAPKALFGSEMRQSGGFSGSVDALAEDIASAGRELTVVLAGGERAASNLCEELCDRNVTAAFVPDPGSVGDKGVFVTVGALTDGFEIPLASLSVVVHGRAVPQKRKRHFKKGAAVGSVEELQRGDYVVHATHGIGIYAGVNQLTTHGMTRDYIKITYAGNDTLYVPVTSLDMVSKYIGNAEDQTVKLNRLGSPEWSRTRSRVKKAVKDMAKQLTALYAKRMQTEGYAFSRDGDLQSDFESRFEFDETDDQLRCAGEIKRDMERSVPMDRLLCGDVGFGKTEVAFRAAFKCIADGKQCAILVPTTILAWQHYNTALERFSGMAVSVEMLSRFRTKGQQEKIKKELRAGNIDLLIGTHSIISKDVHFKDLGLIIVDEEQRFGVAQKERLKELYPTVDALTLSATPIPRTLNMALSGLRDMSSIEEAPLDRRPVQTFVCEQSNGIVDEAISRELRRGGQVYYLHNRTETIESCAARLKDRHPDARIGVAHGKMSEDELSGVWQQLIEREIDILVCTTIIETGVDVPNANTLIIEDSDRLGLAQLHQIRGRVGRSHRTAYAYLLFTPGKVLSEISQKRLDAIRRFTEFGSGFRIAMRDLEIRGAGSILGGEQHGHMEAVGYDMYLKLLSDAIAEEKGETPKDAKECLVDIRMSAHIPEKYIPALPQRLAAYRRIAAVRNADDVLDITDELLDRFGDLPKSVTDLIDISLCKSKAQRLGITEISEKNGSILLYVEGLSEPVSRLITSEMKRDVLFSAGAKPYAAIKMPGGKPDLNILKKALSIMEAEN